MKQFNLILFLLLMAATNNLFSQSSQQTAEEIINDIFEQYSAETEESIDYESFYNDLATLFEYPLDLSKATRDDFEKLAFLSDIQIENILFYIYQNGGLNTIYELQLIEGLDMTDIRRMLPFVQLGAKKDLKEKFYFNEAIKYGKSDLYFRLDKGLEQKKGYLKTKDETGSTSAPYPGSSFYNSLKYNYNFKNRIKFGFTMEKDPGEEFDIKKQGGYDFYSFHFQANNLAFLKNLVLGDFRASFGQGLVFNSGFGVSKSSYVTNIMSRENGLKKFSSSDETNYFRGIGTTFNIKKLEISSFYSNKNIDADTTNNLFTSIYKTGLHRTNDEYAKKHTVNQQLAGIHASLSFNLLRIGLTLAHTQLINDLLPDSAPYNLFYFKGKSQTTAGVDHRFRLGKLNFFGETALTNQAGTGSVNGLLFSPTSTVSIVSLWRYYSPKYDTFYANAFSESTRTNNETGVYTGVEARPFRYWKIAFYADSYRFMWLKYGVNAPTTGQDYLLQADYSPKRNLFMNWRLKLETKEKNNSEQTINFPVKYTKAALRYQLTYNFGNFSTKNLIEVNYSDSAKSDGKIGFAAYQDLSYSFRKIPFSIDLRYLLFDVPDYDNRLYLYEKDILYAFSIPMYSGSGTRFYVNMKYHVSKNFAVWLKIAQTKYSDGRQFTGSGNDEITGNKKTDIRFLLNYKF